MISFANSILMVGRDSANFQWEEWKYEESRPRVSTISVRSLQFQFSNNKKVWIKEHILNQTKSASAMPALNREMHQNFTPILWTPPPSTNFLSHDYTSWIQISCNTSARPAPLPVEAHLWVAQSMTRVTLKIMEIRRNESLKLHVYPKLHRRLFWFLSEVENRIRCSILRASKQRKTRAASDWSLCWYKIKAQDTFRCIIYSDRNRWKETRQASTSSGTECFLG